MRATAPNMDEMAWLRFYRDRRQRLLDEMATLVGYDSYSADKAASDRLADYLQRRLGELGAHVDRIAMDGCGDCLVARWRWDDGEAAGTGALPVLLLAHYDTVWPPGEAERRPFRVDGDVVTGPGSCDMKGGLALALHVIEGLLETGHRPRRPLTLLLNADEEIGSAFSRPVIEAEARNSAAALVIEPSTRPERVVTSRRGTGIYQLAVEGVAAHSGAAHRDGVSAIEELAHHIHRLHRLTDYDRGITVNVGLVKGGVARNVVAPHAEALIDLRFQAPEDGPRLAAAVESLQPVLKGARLTITGGLRRPPMTRTEGNATLFQLARTIARGLNLDLTEGQSGGASDGNFTSAVGTPTLDGLGVVGDGAHTYDEHVEVRWLATRAALLTGLLLSL